VRRPTASLRGKKKKKKKKLTLPWTAYFSFSSLPLM